MFWVSLRKEIGANNSLRVKTFILIFRLTSYSFHFDRTKILYFGFNLFYKLTCFLFKIDILARTEIGWGLRIFHPFCICIHPDVKIGSRCILRHGVTLGNAGEDSNAVPSVGDDVEFGCYATVIGNVLISDGTKVRALSLTTATRRLS